MYKKVLTIGPFDSTGASGVTMDTRVFHNFRYYVASCCTGVFSQNTREIIGYFPIPFATLGNQLEALLKDFEFNGIKISHLPDETTVELISELLQNNPVRPALLDVSILHPLGHRVVSEETLRSMMVKLFPRVDVVVCNADEAGLILGEPVGDTQTMKEAARKILDLECESVILTSRGRETRAMDVMADRVNVKLVDSPKIITENTFGKGTVFSACVLGNLVKGDDLFTSMTKTKRYLQKAMTHNFSVGKGAHPLNLNSPL